MMTMIPRLAILGLVFSIHSPSSSSFVQPSPRRIRAGPMISGIRTWFKKLTVYSTSDGTKNEGDLLASIRSMRVKEIKEELKQRRIPTGDVFEKEELVKRLFDARQKSPSTPKINYIEGDLLFTSMETGRSIPALNRENIRIEGVGKPYPAIQIQVEERFSLTLLVDTACSGFVLRPSVVKQHNIQTYNAPATMTGAAGSTAFTGLAQVGRFNFAGESFGTMPAAVQDIGALPAALDGIVGLSFLQQFVCVEFHISKGKIRLYKKNPSDNGMQVLADAPMKSTRLAIWTVDVLIDGRGPIRMLVDTGATSSILSWQGVTDLGLDRQSVRPLTNSIGALGSDNVAMRLTHTLPVKHAVQLGGQDSSFTGLDVKTANLSIDIGDIAILESQLKADRVVGIMGMDIFLQCTVIRMSFSGSGARISIFE